MGYVTVATILDFDVITEAAHSWLKVAQTRDGIPSAVSALIPDMGQIWYFRIDHIPN